MTKKQKKVLVRIIIAAVLVIALQFIPVKGYARFGLYMIPYLVIGYDILKKAGKGIWNRQIFDEIIRKALRLCSSIRSESCFRARPLVRAVGISVS